MRGRKSSRGAAVVLAGCVGLAVMAPGLAVAAPGPTTNRDCAELYGTGSVLDATEATGCTTPKLETSTSPAPSPSARVPDAGTGTGTETGAADEGAGAPANGSSSAARTPSAPSSSGPSTLDSGSTSEPTARVTRAQVTEGGQALAQAAATNAIILPGGVTIPDTFVPGQGNLPLTLPFTVPTTVPTGGFTSPRQQCGFLASGLTVPVDQAAALGAAFSQFCGALPDSFTGLDPTDLVQDLLDIINGLIPSLPGNGGTIPTSPPAAVPAAYQGYWHHQYDVDCGDVTYDEAQTILAYDRSDPFNLDGDNDGEACEDNGHGSHARYIGYPVGGVSTGDGSTGTMDASPAALALAGAGVGGLALAGLTLVRRFGREG
jgi:hypothetical protein